METSEDLELVERMLDGDESAFEVFGERYSRAVLRFALGKLGGDRELAREIAQTAICKALARLESYRGEASLLTWLCSCCRNEILMHLRSRRAASSEVPVGEDTEPEAGFRVATFDNPEVRVLDEERDRLVHMVLDVLPEHYARALEWKYLERLSVREISERMGAGSKAVESLLSRARRRFETIYQQLLDERLGATSGSGRRSRDAGR